MRPTAARESPRRCRARAPPSRRHAGVGSTSRCPPVLSLPRHDGRSDDGRPDDGRTALDRTRRRAHGPTAARAAPRRPGLHHDRSSNPADLAVGCVTSRPIGPRRTTDAQRPADPPTRRPAENSESAPNRSESTRTHPSSTSSTTFCKRVSTLSVGSDDPVARRRVRDATKPSRRHRKRQREGSCRIRRRRTGQRRKSSNEVLCRRATTARVA